MTNVCCVPDQDDSLACSHNIGIASEGLGLWDPLVKPCFFTENGKRVCELM